MKKERKQNGKKKDTHTHVKHTTGGNNLLNSLLCSGHIRTCQGGKSEQVLEEHSETSKERKKRKRSFGPDKAAG